MSPRPALAVVLLVACAPPPPVPPGAASVPDRTATVEAVARGEVPTGRWRVGPALVATPLALDGVTAFVQDPVTGAGLEVQLGGRVDGWPPPVGTPVSLVAWVAPELATAWIRATGDVQVLGPPEPLEVRPPALARPLDLVRFPDVLVRSEPDPSGRAELSVGLLAGAFPFDPPGYGNRGALTALVLPDGTLAPRSDADWEGRRDPGIVLAATVADLAAGALPEGATVRFPAVQATPWSRDGRALLQGPGGEGVWLDTEGWGHPDSGPGDAATWTAQIRAVDGHPGLRTWWAPTPGGTGEVRAVDDPVHGALVEVGVSGLGPPTPLGERRTDEGWLLDDRFRPLTDLPDPATVRAAVDEAGGPRRLAVVEVL